MQIKRINCPQNFQGSVTAIGLSKSQEKVFNGLKDMLIKKVADKDYLILHIDGSISSKYIAGDYSKEPKYVIMHTQVKPITRSTASAYTDSLNPNDWLKTADKVIRAHMDSDLYNRAVNGELDSFWAKLKNKIGKILNKEK